MKRILVINAVALTAQLLKKHSPDFLNQWNYRSLVPDFPAVTCTVQSSILTGLAPQDHGIVGNGWYNHELSEIQFWKQSNPLVQGKKIWDVAKVLQPSFKTAKMFWWYNMYSTVDYSCTPRPCYPADGRKIPDFYTFPETLKSDLLKSHGPFPLFKFWGPGADIESTRWIGEATASVLKKYQPQLMLCYLPHLDYILQKQGPEGPDVGAHVRDLVRVIENLIKEARSSDYEVVILSEYGIEEAKIDLPLNRLFREKGWLAVREEEGLELLDPGASKVFAVCDHQIAHVYVQDTSLMNLVQELLESRPEIDGVYGLEDREQIGLNCRRAGDIVVSATKGHWFSYYYWLNDEKAPDFARTVDIHRKPGYDPAELMLDPDLSWPKLKIARHILKQKLGFRSLLEVIPMNGSGVRGTHGRIDLPEEQGPLFLTEEESSEQKIHCRDIKNWILKRLELNQ